MEDYSFKTFDEEKPSENVYVLIIYDIVENKKRLKLAKFLQAYGFRVQKSCFEAKISDKKYKEIISRIGVFASREDSIRVYKIIGTGQVTLFGDKKEVEDEDLIIL